MQDVRDNFIGSIHHKTDEKIPLLHTYHERNYIKLSTSATVVIMLFAWRCLVDFVQSRALSALKKILFSEFLFTFLSRMLTMRALCARIA